MTVRNTADSIFKPAFLLMSGRAVGFVATFMIPVVLVRVFNQTDFGTYKQLFLIFSTLFGIAQMGMAESLYYFLPTYPESSQGYVANSLLILTLAGVAGLVLLWAGGGQISLWLNNPALDDYLPVMGLYFVCMLVSAILEIIMIAKRQHALASMTYVLSDLVRTCLFLLPALILQNLHWLLIGALAFAGTRLTLTLLYLKRQLQVQFRPDWSLMRRHCGYALPFAAGVLIEMLQSNLHMYVVSARFTPAAFAIYSIGCLQIPLVDFMTTSTANVMMVRMSSYLREQRHEAALELWRDTSRKLAIIFVPLVGALIVTASSLIPGLFTTRYAASVPLFMVWSLLMLFPVLMTNGVLRVFADTKFIIIKNTVKLAIIAIGINVFITAWGMMGAVLITLLAMATAKIIDLLRISRLMRCGWRQVLPWRDFAYIGAIAVTAALPVVALKASLDLPPLLEALVNGTAYGLLCAAGTWFYGPLNQADRETILYWVQVPIARISRVWKT